MPKLTITPEDLKRSMVADANWYPVQVTSVVQERNKKGDADNIVVDLTIVTSGDEDRDKFADVVARTWFSEKAPGIAAPFIVACGGSIDPEEGGEFEFAGALNKQIEAYIMPRTFEGRMLNNVKDYATLGTHTGDSPEEG
jgi:hypothetical protein